MEARRVLRAMAAAALMLSSVPPALAQAPDAAAADACKEGDAASGVMLMGIQAECEAIDPFYKKNKRRIDKLIRKYLSCVPADDPDLKGLRQDLANPQKPRSQFEQDDTRRECTEYKANIDVASRPKSARYASPQATWTEYRAALIAHDRERARRCLLPEAGSVEDVLSLPDADLTRTGRSLAADVKVTSTVEDQAAAVTATIDADGSRRLTLTDFVLINGNWFIGTL